MGYVQMAFAGSQILGIPIGLLLANNFGWHSTFWMVVALASLIAIATVIKLKPLKEHLKLQQDKHPILHLWHTIRKKDYRVGFLATAVLSMGGFMIMPFSSAFLVNNVAISQNDLPVIFLFTGIASMIIMPLIGKISDRIDKFKIFTAGTMIAIVMILIYSNLTPVHIAIVILVNVFLFMGIMSRMVPATALNSAVPEHYDRGAYMSINSSLQQTAGGFAAMFAGFVVVQKTETSPLENFNLLGYIMVGLMLWCLYLVWKVKVIVIKKQDRHMTDDTSGRI